MTRRLSQQAIVDVARQIADEEGLEALTLRRIAREFTTGQSSLYRHIRDRTHLLELLKDGLGAGYPILGEPPLAEELDVVRQWLAIRDYLRGHPWAAPLLAEGKFISDSARPVAEHCLQQFESIGLSGDDAMLAYRGFWHLILGDLLSRHIFGVLQGVDPDRDDLPWALSHFVKGVMK